jgi:DNA-binding response OmpR family regulator
MGTQFDPGLLKPYRVRVVDADDVLFDLIAEWLAAAGHGVIPENAGADSANGRIDLVIVDVPFPRRGGLELLRRLAAEHPRTPILALSSTFFSGVGGNEAVARALGVAGVLPKPLKREALIAAVEDLLARSR